jgi:hypothetical protein
MKRKIKDQLNSSKLENKQANSAINMYSLQYLQETLDSRTHILSNDAIR